MGEKRGFSSVMVVLMMVALLSGGCAGKPGTARIPGEQETVSRTPVSASDFSESLSEEDGSSVLQTEETSLPSQSSQTSQAEESSAVSDSLEEDDGLSSSASEPVSESDTEPDPAVSEAESSQPEVSSEPSEASQSLPVEAQPADKDGFKLWSPESDVLPESAAVDNSYFSDALFIGDSRMQGFVLYSGLTDVTGYTSVGLTVDTAYSKAFVDLSGEKLTLADALGRVGANYKRFYLLFGMNELGWGTWSVFVSKYGGLIDIIQKANPDAVIYLESLIPLTKEKSSQSEWLNNDHINSFNQMIWQLAKDKGVYYLDTALGLADENGVLPAEDSTDGVHLNKAACGRWLDYLKTHTAGDFS